MMAFFWIFSRHSKFILFPFGKLEAFLVTILTYSLAGVSQKCEVRRRIGGPCHRARCRPLQRRTAPRVRRSVAACASFGLMFGCAVSVAKPKFMPSGAAAQFHSPTLDHERGGRKMAWSFWALFMSFALRSQQQYKLAAQIARLAPYYPTIPPCRSLCVCVLSAFFWM